MYIQIITVLLFFPLHIILTLILCFLLFHIKYWLIDYAQYRIIPCYKTGSNLISALMRQTWDARGY